MVYMEVCTLEECEEGLMSVANQTFLTLRLRDKRMGMSFFHPRKETHTHGTTRLRGQFY